VAFRPSEGGRVLDRGGATLGRLDYVRRINVPLARVPRHVRAAFIAVEDRRFYYHGGVDWRSAARALLRNVREADVSEGFSTITMQVVRNAFVPRLAQQRSFRRKLIEIHLAHRLERALTKQQILALYLNVIYLGNGAYGVEAASEDLFGKSVDRLTVAEGATLAALARGPSVYAPRRHPDRALARRLRTSRLKNTAAVEDIDYQTERGLDRGLLRSLCAESEWVKQHQNIFLIGPTGMGKSWLACALAHKACRDGYTAYYARASH